MIEVRDLRGIYQIGRPLEVGLMFGGPNEWLEWLGSMS
jgi:hypothetical protein